MYVLWYNRVRVELMSKRRLYICWFYKTSEHKGCRKSETVKVCELRVWAPSLHFSVSFNVTYPVNQRDGVKNKWDDKCYGPKGFTSLWELQLQEPAEASRGQRSFHFVISSPFKVARVSPSCREANVSKLCKSKSLWSYYSLALVHPAFTTLKEYRKQILLQIRIRPFTFDLKDTKALRMQNGGGALAQCDPSEVCPDKVQEFWTRFTKIFVVFNQCKLHADAVFVSMRGRQPK